MVVILQENNISKTENTEMLRFMQKSSQSWNQFNHPAKVVQNLTSSVNNVKRYSSSNPQSLPYLPVPKLNDTLNKFLKSTQPHLSPSSFKNTQNVVNKFVQDHGPKLQALLEKRAAQNENWLSDWWLQSAYLEYRDPVIVFSSPGLVFPQRKFNTLDDKVKFAAKVISAALSYKNLIDNKKLPVEMMGKAQLDMAQYEKIFGTCRVPGVKSDSLTFNGKSKHIVIAVNDTFFKVPVYDGAGKLLSEDQVVSQIKSCMQKSGNSSKPVGILTSDNRDNWGLAYNELVKDDLNKKSFEDIQQSLFVISIDKELPQMKDGDDIVTACHQLIHGGGSRGNAANRWYDKTVQFIVGNTGINGLTYEHSPAEGQPIAVLTDYVISYIDKNKCENSAPVQHFEEPKALDFNISSSVVEKSIKTAAENVDKLAEDLDMNYLHFTDYGKDFIKTQKMSPDSYIQMAIQYAFYRLHKVPGAHYESAQTRMYVHGRTETIRSCSNESVAFAKAMSEGRDNADKVIKLKEAVKGHKDYVAMAVQGFGVDRHLLGLKLIAKENNLPIPELFSDEGYLKSAHMRISTSQVASTYDAFMCYGPLTKDGYGCCYSPKNNDMWFGLSSFKSCPDTSTAKFRKSLEEALRDMYDLLIKHGEPPKSKL